MLILPTHLGDSSLYPNGLGNNKEWPHMDDKRMGRISLGGIDHANG